jgi:ankyrin repeat protein
MKPQRHLVASLALAICVSACALFVPSRHRTEEYTPLVAAAEAGDLTTVRAAVEKDPSLLNVREWDDATLLHDAVGQAQEAVAAYLLGKGADPNARMKNGVTPLHMAAQNGDLAMINLLLEPRRKTNINPVDAKGWTPLDRAIRWHHPEAAEVLRQHGAHVGAAGQ